MGLTCSSTKDDLSFHPYCKGSFISLNTCLHEANRSYSFHDGLIFSNRPLLPREKFCIKVVEVESRWYGALRVGFTTMDPNMMYANSLPPFACPDLTVKPGFWAIGVPAEFCHKGSELCFWVNRKGEAVWKKHKSSRPRVLFSGLPTKTPLWVMLDVYGQTKTIQLKNHKSKQMKSHCSCCINKEQKSTRNSLPPTSNTSLSVQPRNQSRQTFTTLDFHPESQPFFQEDDPVCVICNDRLADTLLLPCLHCSFCESCALKVEKQNGVCPLCRQTILHTQNIGEMNLQKRLYS